MSTEVTLDKIIALCKRRGFIFPSADIYGGINGVYDVGPLGNALKQNIKNAWLQHITSGPEEVLVMDGAILGHHEVWKASGHVDNFADPLVDCLNCKKRYRADDIDLEKSCTHCGIKNWTGIRQFKLMFETQVGAMADATSVAYLRPETAQAIFINFKNVFSTNRVKIPFGIAQIGKAFRNEITPKQFIFRMREFEQMEVEFFCKEEDASRFFESWLERRKDFYLSIGIKPEHFKFRAHEKDELAHYSKNCTDVEFLFPFGWKELEGIANRGNFDLTQHSKFSGKDLAVYDDTLKTSYTPHVIECSVGVDRLLLALLSNAYHEDVVEGETRTVLQLAPSIAPVLAAFMPLTKKQSEATTCIYQALKKEGFAVQLDESGSIGKRYRRQDEIGTPVCFTYDFESETDQMVTVRDRDTLKQERIYIDRLSVYLKDLLKR